MSLFVALMDFEIGPPQPSLWILTIDTVNKILLDLGIHRKLPVNREFLRLLVTPNFIKKNQQHNGIVYVPAEYVLRALQRVRGVGSMRTGLVYYRLVAGPSVSSVDLGRRSI